MYRREVITTLAGGSLVALAGCSGGGSSSEEQTDGQQTATPTPTEGSASAKPTGDVGVTRVTKENIRVTLKDALTTDALVDDGEYTSSQQGNRYLLLHLQVRNNSDDEKEIPAHGDLSLRTSDGIRQNQVTSEHSELSEPVGSTYTPDGGFRGPQIDPGAQVRGWLAYTVSADQREFTVELPDLLTDGGDTVAWDVTVPESTGVVFEEELTKPDSARADSETSMTVTVRNTGNRQGRVARTYMLERYDRDPLQKSIQGGLGPGEEQSVQFTFTPATVGDHRISSPVTDHEPLTVKAPQFTFGETWESTMGFTIEIANATLTDTIVYSNNDSDRLELTPDAGKQFLVFEATPKNEQTYYFDTTVAATANGQRATFAENEDELNDAFARGYDERLVSPLSGRPWELSTTFDYTTESGVFFMQVPDTFTTDDLTIRLEHERDYGETVFAAEWSSA